MIIAVHFQSDLSPALNVDMSSAHYNASSGITP